MTQGDIGQSIVVERDMRREDAAALSVPVPQGLGDQDDPRRVRACFRRQAGRRQSCSTQSYLSCNPRQSAE